MMYEFPPPWIMPYLVQFYIKTVILRPRYILICQDKHCLAQTGKQNSIKPSVLRRQTCNASYDYPLLAEVQGHVVAPVSGRYT